MIVRRTVLSRLTTLPELWLDYLLAGRPRLWHSVIGATERALASLPSPCHPRAGPGARTLAKVAGAVVVTRWRGARTAECRLGVTGMDVPD